MKVHHLRIEKTARYYVLGRPGPNVRRVWFVCHGYGQLAGHFIKHFEACKDRESLIVAPEALSRFYLNGFSGRVGASWMTREDRESEIEDYLDYFDATYQQVSDSLGHEQAALCVLGFSQGTAAVCRWVVNRNVKVDHLVLWAGGVPPELHKESAAQALRRTKLTLVRGDADDIATPEAVAKQRAFLENDSIPYRYLTFSGGHRMDADVLRSLVRV